MNAAIRAITRSALDNGIEVMGIIGGYSGLLNDKMIPLTSSSVSNIIAQGGTVLYSDRCLDFKTPEGMAKAIATCKKHNIDAIVAIGGDGTFRGATDLTLHGIPTIGVSWGYGKVEAMVKAGAIAIAHTMDELLAIINQ